jgi:hypothetical protein
MPAVLCACDGGTKLRIRVVAAIDRATIAATF